MKRSIPALALCALAAPLPAQAQTWTIGEGAPRGPHESAQNFAFEARFAPWQPDIDSEFGGRATPFYDYFGYSERASLTSPEIRRVRDRLLGGLEVDWQALRFGPVASLGVGVGVTYSDFTTTAPVTNGGGGASGQTSTLHVLPMYAVLVARLDVLARRTVVPLVLYGKAGVAVTHWWVNAGDDFARRSAASPVAPNNTSDFGRSARGFSYGWQFAVGAMLRLDFLEPRVQRSWDIDMGVNHSYLFAEYMVVTDWSRPQLHVASNTWVFGLAFEL